MTDAPLDLEGWTCPLPLRDYPTIVLGHGGGGKLSSELVEHLFLPAFASATLAGLGDSAIVDVAGTRVAFSTDSFVVRPLFFPGGNIGELAVNGTVNDIAMSGAQPIAMSVGFILEEGLPLARLGLIAEATGKAARDAGVELVTGDTKVVDQGHGDGVYLNTSGFGIVPDGVAIGPDRARPGDVVIVSGDIGVHGIAIMSVREGIEFGTVVESDTMPLNGLVATMLEASRDVHTLRDPTRGGLAATLNEIARTSKVGVEYEERLLPIPEAVASACGFLGLDPIHVANEGKLVAMVPAAVADDVLSAMQAHPAGNGAVVIGRVVDDHPGVVVARTAIGGTRIVDTQIGQQLPRIC
ncbi:MAG: hydrogenase expression/formation protein HypE [Acidimicrobiia bacterium]